MLPPNEQCSILLIGGTGIHSLQHALVTEGYQGFICQYPNWHSFQSEHGPILPTLTVLESLPYPTSWGPVLHWAREAKSKLVLIWAETPPMQVHEALSKGVDVVMAPPAGAEAYSRVAKALLHEFFGMPLQKESPFEAELPD